MEHKNYTTIEHITRKIGFLKKLLYPDSINLKPFDYTELDDAKVFNPTDFDQSSCEWHTIPPASYWGKSKQNFLMKSSLCIPKKWAGRQIALLLPIGSTDDFSHPEALVYIDGKPLTGLDSNHQEISLPDIYCDDKEHQVILHGWTKSDGFSEEKNVAILMRQCKVVTIDQGLRDFIVKARTALKSAKVMSNNSPARWNILNALDASFKCIDAIKHESKDFQVNLDLAMQTLDSKLKNAGVPLDVNLTAVGHSHIDVAWLWTVTQTRLKAGRSFHTVMHLMEKFPEYCFSQSQPQLYEYLKEDYPELFENIKQKVKQGRWEILGGMWVEADCNISGSESLVRQFLLGRNFFAEHFGKDTESPILWLPDVFGYPYSLPQLMKLAGIKYFFTTKLFWNRYNRFPYESFLWEGIDGTKVISHFCATPAPEYDLDGTYNGKGTPEEMYNTWDNFTQKESQKDLITCFGHGDGGGGPTRQMLENIRELKNFSGMPKVKHGKAIDVFEKMEEYSEELPIWNGELYLEYHRGTYTTQSSTKKANRKCEFALHDSELIASIASLVSGKYEYPNKKFNQCWKRICLNQFHDIIPGTSIPEVYVQVLEDYQQVLDSVKAIQSEAMEVIRKSLPVYDIVVFNPTSFEHDNFALYDLPIPPDCQIVSTDGKQLLYQKTETGVLIDCSPIKPMSFKTLKLLPKKQSQHLDNSVKVTKNIMENSLIRIEINSDGDIIRIYDKQAQREVIPTGCIANQIQAFEDIPVQFDAWELELNYENRQYLVESAHSVKVIATGPIRGTIEIKRKILNSEIQQLISINYNSKQITFETHVDWNQSNTLLKAAFPVDIHTNNATYDIQWGNIERPTHRNTSWDIAKFEVCAQKWADLSEQGYGVSLLNDCKYGYDIYDNLMRLTLLRSPTHPDPEADRGTHKFTYALLPHADGWRNNTEAHAYMLNNPIIVFGDNTGTERKASAASKIALDEPFIKTDKKNVIIETVKKTEDGKNLIVRLYESHNTRGQVNIYTAFDFTDCCEVDLLEGNPKPLATDGRSISLYMKPYEIKTISFEF